MSEKYYTLGTHTAEQWSELHAELIADGNTYESVPSREVSVDDDALVASTKAGAFVHCWVWVENAVKPKRTRKKTV
jgi:DNA/RNA-binding domain of Phe-tRNA-synthetase-like protein